MLSIFKRKQKSESQDQLIKLENCVDPVEELREEDLLLVSGGTESGGGGGSYNYAYS